jgi:K+-dependent Na+/Ca+ exchanger-like protein
MSLCWYYNEDVTNFSVPDALATSMPHLPTWETGRFGRELLETTACAEGVMDCVNGQDVSAWEDEKRCQWSFCGSQRTEGNQDVANGDGPPGLYPNYWFTQKQRISGAIVIHILILCYMFCGLAIICDEYFVPALEVICEQLKLKDDVAGATFMAAGGSAPEFATSILGVFFSKSDIGFAAIVGSAVFNVLFVIGGCALVATGVTLTWWPLARDCSYYICSIMLLVICIFDQKIMHFESIMLILGYIGYVIIMKFNEDLEKYVNSKLRQARDYERNRPRWRQVLFIIAESWIFNIFIYGMIVLSVLTAFLPMVETAPAPAIMCANMSTFESSYTAYKDFDPTVYQTAEVQSTILTWDIINFVCVGVFVFEMLLKWAAYTFFGYMANGLNNFDMVLVALMIFELSIAQRKAEFRVIRALRFLRALRLLRLLRLVMREKRDASTQWVEDDWEQDYVRAVPVKCKRANSIAWRRTSKVVEEPLPLPEPKETDLQTEVVEKDEDDDDDEDDDPPNPFYPPEGLKARIYWAIMFPLAVLIFFTVPHPKRPRLRKLYFVAFLMCVLWIIVLSYVMVWMATVIGITVGIPDPVMGLTVLAAGTSVPDLLESLAVARKGQGDMAVSSSIGSNVFDLLMGLPFPWLLSTLIVPPRRSVCINSKGMTISVLLLFLMVGATVALIVLEGWKLTRRMAIVFVLLYFVFLTVSLLLEYGLFDAVLGL